MDKSGNVNLTWVNQTTKTLAVQNGTLSGTITYACNETGIAGCNLNLTLTETMIATATTDGNGDYEIPDLSPGEYNLTASKIGFWPNPTSLTLTEVGKTIEVNLALFLKGDLNNNGNAADNNDYERFRNATLGIITPDWKYDLNINGIYAEAGDYAMMKDASIDKVELRAA